MASKKRKPVSRFGALIAYAKKNPGIITASLQLANAALLIYAQHHSAILSVPYVLVV